LKYMTKIHMACVWDGDITVALCDGSLPRLKKTVADVCREQWEIHYWDEYWEKRKTELEQLVADNNPEFEGFVDFDDMADSLVQEEGGPYGPPILPDSDDEVIAMYFHSGEEGSFRIEFEETEVNLEPYEEPE